jgi:hypothetical protein
MFFPSNAHDAVSNRKNRKSNPALYVQFHKKLVSKAIYCTGIQFHFLSDFLIGHFGAGKLKERKFLFTQEILLKHHFALIVDSKELSNSAAGVI